MAWEQLVGEAASKVSKAVSIRNQLLIVQVNDPLWMHQLYLIKNELLKKYRRAFPKLQLRGIFYTHSR